MYQYEYQEYPYVPTLAQWRNLINHTSQKEVTEDGVKGVKFTSNNGASIFLPYQGCSYDNTTTGTATYYWTQTPYDSKKAYAILLKDGKATITQCQKRTGLMLRLVCPITEYEDPYSISSDFDADGINGVKVVNAEKDTIYTLQGVKVEGNLKPGIYVKNGRKFVVK